MPTITHFGGITIHLYYNDHDPPHFHVNYSGILTRIEINTGEYLKGDIPIPRVKEKEVLNWLDNHKDDMMKAWKACRNNQVPDKIPPL